LLQKRLNFRGKAGYVSFYGFWRVCGHVLFEWFEIVGDGLNGLKVV
jgi:hypothetical protein